MCFVLFCFVLNYVCMLCVCLLRFLASVCQILCINDIGRSSPATMCGTASISANINVRCSNRVGFTMARRMAAAVMWVCYDLCVCQNTILHQNNKLMTFCWCIVAMPNAINKIQNSKSRAKESCGHIMPNIGKIVCSSGVFARMEALDKLKSMIVLFLEASVSIWS